MKDAKKKRLEAAGWKVGDTKEFLGLSDDEAELIELKLALARGLKRLRQRKRLTQEGLAKRIKSSQPRVAKLESADASVSVDLLIKSLIKLGTTRKELGQIIAAKLEARAA